MWNFQSKRNALREHMVVAAPEVNPHEFVRRLLRSQVRVSAANDDLHREPRVELPRVDAIDARTPTMRMANP